MKHTLLVALSLCSLLLSGCNNGDKRILGDDDGQWSFNALSLQVSPAEESLPIGLTEQLHAEASKQDKTTEDVTESVKWQSSQPDIVSVNQYGEATALKATETPIIITAKGTNANGSTLESQSKITVTTQTIESVQVTPVNGHNTLLADLPMPYEAKAAFSDGMTRDITQDPALSWRSSDEAIATVTNNIRTSNGIVTGLSIGKADIIASLTINGAKIEGSAAVQVLVPTSFENFEVQPIPADSTPETIIGGNVDFVANVTVEGQVFNVTDSPALSWLSSDTDVARVETGLNTQRATATGIAAGTTLISATAYGNSYSSNEIELTVSTQLISELNVSQEFTKVPVQLPQELTATALTNEGASFDVTTQVEWSIAQESEPGVATLDGNVLTGLKAGSVIVQAQGVAPDGTRLDAQSEDIIITPDAVTRLDVYPISYNLPSGMTKAFTATAIVNDTTTYDVSNNSAIHWLSENNEIATVSDNGIVSARALTDQQQTTTNIVATLDVNSDTLLSDTSLLSVTATPISALEVLAENDVIPIGLTEHLQAQVHLEGVSTPISVTDSVSWQSDNDNMVITSGLASENGIVTVKSTATQGETANITATLHNADGSQEVVETQLLTAGAAVGETIHVEAQDSEDSGELPTGLTRQYEATLMLTNGNNTTNTSQENLTWSVTSGEEFINVDEHTGLVTALSLGEGSIQATYSGPTVSGHALTSEPVTVVVSDAVIEENSLIVVVRDTTTEAEEQCLPKGVSVQYSALATFSDSNEPKDVTAQVSWVVNPAEQSTVTLDTSTKGKGYVSLIADNVSTEPVSLIATYEDVQNDSVNVMVSNAELIDFYLTPETSNIVKEGNQQLTAMGMFTDNSEVDISTEVIWSSSDDNVATVDASGLVSAVGEIDETTVISASSLELSMERTSNVNIVLGMCGDGVDDSDPTNVTGPCLKVATDAIGNWFTSTPSLSVMNALGYTLDDSDDNVGDTYASSNIELSGYGPEGGEFAQFRQDGQDVVTPEDDESAGINGQFDRWCQKLSAIEFAGKSNWRRPTESELAAFYQKYDDDGTGGGLWDARGWPTNVSYTSSTVLDLGYYSVHLYNGYVSNNYPRVERYASCISNH